MKILAALFLSLLYATLALAEAIWVMNCWDNEEAGESVFMCLDKTKNGYKGTLSFTRICKNQPQYGRIAVIGKGNQKNLSLSTKAGSKFNVTYAKASDGMDFIKINPNFSQNEKIAWEKSDSCKAEITSVPKQFESYMQNNRINLLQRGLN